MSKKNKAHKKHRFKYATPTTDVATPQAGPAVKPAASAKPAAAKVPAPAAPAVAEGRDFSYVARDLRVLGVMITGLVVLELGLWWLFAHTSLGDTVYSWIKL